MGAAGKKCGSKDRGAGKSLIRVGAVGIRIWKTPPRFPNSWTGGQTFPLPTIPLQNRSHSSRSAFTEPAPTRETTDNKRTHNFQAHNQATTPTRATFPPSRFQAYTPFSPSQDKTTLQIPPNRPNNEHNSRLGRAKLHREGQNVTKKEARPVNSVSNDRRAGESLFRVGAGNGFMPRGRHPNHQDSLKSDTR